MWNYLKQKQTVVLAAFLLLAGVGAVAITATMDRNNNQGKETTRHVDEEPEEEDNATTKKADDGYKEPKGVSETKEPVYEQDNDTSMVNPGVVSTPMSFASVTTTNVVVELEPGREEAPIQLAKANDLDKKTTVVEAVAVNDNSTIHGEDTLQDEKTTRSFEVQ